MQKEQSISVIRIFLKSIISSFYISFPFSFQVLMSNIIHKVSHEPHQYISHMDLSSSGRPIKWVGTLLCNTLHAHNWAVDRPLDLTISQKPRYSAYQQP